MTPITASEFARLKGVSDNAVSKAIKEGRLRNCLVWTEGKKKPKLNPLVAAQEWEKNTDHSKRTVGADIRPRLPDPEPYIHPDAPQPAAPASGPSISQSRAVLEAYKARLAKIEYEEKAGKLVEAEKVKAEAYKMARTVRDALLNIPDRVAAELAGCSNAGEIHMRLNQEIRQALEGLIASAPA